MLNEEQKTAIKVVEELNQTIEENFILGYENMPTFSILISTDFYEITYNIPDYYNPIELEIFNSADNDWDGEGDFKEVILDATKSRRKLVINSLNYAKRMLKITLDL